MISQIKLPLEDDTHEKPKKIPTTDPFLFYVSYLASLIWVMVGMKFMPKN